MKDNKLIKLANNKEENVKQLERIKNKKSFLTESSKIIKLGSNKEKNKTQFRKEVKENNPSIIETRESSDLNHFNKKEAINTQREQLELIREERESLNSRGENSKPNSKGSFEIVKPDSNDLIYDNLINIGRDSNPSRENIKEGNVFDDLNKNDSKKPIITFTYTSPNDIVNEYNPIKKKLEKQKENTKDTKRVAKKIQSTLGIKDLSESAFKY